MEARRIAVARPIPPVPPVIRTVLPVIEFVSAMGSFFPRARPFRPGLDVDSLIGSSRVQSRTSCRFVSGGLSAQ